MLAFGSTILFVTLERVVLGGLKLPLFLGTNDVSLRGK
jgi:hypothetical protein